MKEIHKVPADSTPNAVALSRQCCDWPRPMSDLGGESAAAGFTSRKSLNVTQNRERLSDQLHDPYAPYPMY